MTPNAPRFSGRAADYALGRPGYPEAVVDTLEASGLVRGDLVIDAGAGTGLASLLFLRRGYRVIAIEPNPEMRQAALGAGIDARPGSGEDTGLPGAEAGLVVCAQAFHWMDRPRAWREFQRIVRPSGLIALLWNDRVTSGTDFLDRLEPILVRHAESDPRTSENPELRRWPGTHHAVFRHAQLLDWSALLSRVCSMSWMPRRGSSGFDALAADLESLFAQCQRDGRVEMIYDCSLYWAVQEAR